MHGTGTVMLKRLCLYLWPMWTEHRAIVSDASALKEVDERRQKELEKFRENTEKT